MKGQIRELNISIKECIQCPFRQIGKYTYIDSSDTVDYCNLSKRTIYWTYAREGFPEMCSLPIKNNKEKNNDKEITKS